MVNEMVKFTTFDFHSEPGNCQIWSTWPHARKQLKTSNSVYMVCGVLESEVHPRLPDTCAEVRLPHQGIAVWLVSSWTLFPSHFLLNCTHSSLWIVKNRFFNVSSINSNNFNVFGITSHPISFQCMR